jgi:hypothetical protein
MGNGFIFLPVLSVQLLIDTHEALAYNETYRFGSYARRVNSWALMNKVPAWEYG